MLMQILVMLLLTVCMYPAAKVVVIIIRRAAKHFIQWELRIFHYILNMEGPNTMYQEQTHFITADIHTYLCGFRNMLILCFFLPD